MGSIIKQFLFGKAIFRIKPGYLKHAFGERAGLVKNNVFRIRKGFKIVGTFYKDAVLRSTADPCKKAERY